MYMELMESFFDEVEKFDESSNEKIYEELVKNKELINNISINVENTRLFKTAEEQFLKYQEEFFNNFQEPKERVVAAYTDLMAKIADAPTALHMRGAIILIMPLLNNTLSLLKLNQKENL